ncbi:hypothetical protein [Deinococcus soli (ex Cha et al. 2016)]|uniref:Uncharacterized protein n=1 Tax=Deinococcus soli (ex Cha et al. 2016) TaxID=1309411 RepID=A0ACC6KNI6_9DEIO|nr:hypothetical protein [Deinococcus soli (ex Cha et al. 2016)]MDR6330637.1 hypothetical protein [Deinococcus soli (ex Cha et al. 2016)]MDR6754004.1 hypothetical protein [Deinococcus soli (ex Cha et al. 2016)]
MTLTTRPCPWGCGAPLTFVPEPEGSPAHCPGCSRRASVQGDQLIRVQPSRVDRALLGMVDALRHLAVLLERHIGTPPEPPRPRAAPACTADQIRPVQARPRDRRPERSPATRRY